MATSSSSSMFPPAMREAITEGEMPGGEGGKVALMRGMPSGTTEQGASPRAMAPRGMEAKGATALNTTAAGGMPRKIMRSEPAGAVVLAREAASAGVAEISAAAAAIGVAGWGRVHPTLPGIWTWSDNLWVGADVRTRGLELICEANGSGIVRFKLIQQSLASLGGTGCERDDYWAWDHAGSCAVSGQALQFSVSGQYSLTYPNGWISGTCNPSLNTSNPISDLIEFPFWQVVGTGTATRLDLSPPASWGTWALPNMALSRLGGVATWSPWDTLDGYCIDGVAVSSWGPERLDVFTVSGDGAMWHRAWFGTVWTDWESLGGACISAPAAVSWGPNRIDAFVIGPDHALYHQWWDSTKWSGWAEKLGGYCLYGVTAVSRGTNQLDVFVIGPDRAIWHKAFDGSTWSDWGRIDSSCISAPAAAATSNWIDLYVLGDDHAVYHNAWHDAAWHGWFSLGGYGEYGVAATTWPDVYTIGGDGALYRNIWTGSDWSGWASLGGGSLSAPAAVSWGPGHIDAFVIGTDHACWHKWYG